jgi:hypothetical protein
LGNKVLKKDAKSIFKVYDKKSAVSSELRKINGR